MPIPRSISYDHVLQAMELLGDDPGKWPKNRLSRHFDVVHPDPAKRWRMPPKLVMSVASKIATGSELKSDQFSGGPEVNNRLRDLGFDVVHKRQLSLLPLQGSGRGMWGKDVRQTLQKLRDEWDRN